MKVPSQLLVLSALVCSSPFVCAQDNITDNVVQSLPSSMSLTQFQSVLHTFLDDEMAVVVDELASSGDVDAAAPAADMLESTLEGMLTDRISSIVTGANGNRRRILKNHKHKHHDKHKHHKDKSSKEDLPDPHQRGRFTDVDPSSIPNEVNATWDGIISHAWTMAKLNARSEPDEKSSSKLRGRRGKKGQSSSSADSEDKDEHTSLFDDDDHEFITEWSNETETLFLVCHTSTQDLDGNTHLKEILTAAGKDVNVTNANIEVVHSSPKLTCVILGMQPTYAWNIAGKRSVADGNSTLNIVPFVDVMKISPELFDEIFSIESLVEETDEGHKRQRGLGNLRRAQDNVADDDSTEGNDDLTADEVEEPIMWTTNTSESNTTNVMENKYVVFSLTSPSTIEDAQDVVQNLVEMAQVGQRRKMQSETHGSKRSIGDAFSITRGSFNADGNMPLSSRHWSRILETGLESNSGCSELFQDITLQTSFVKSSYEFILSPTNTMNSTVYLACVASAVAGLAVNPRVINVGIVPRHVELDNDKAQWVLQGSVKASDSTTWRRPFFDAGIKGHGQIVSVSDTGLDTGNCYFKDGRGDGNIFTEWDESRRKVVRYDISSRGGDKNDAYRGHGTHVVGTLTGKHIRGKMGDGDDPKEGMAPAAKVHFFDIGLKNAVNDPREEWIDSFYKNGDGKGAKIASGSWGFGYRTSYDWVCRLYDKLVFDKPDVLHIASAGNTGNQFSSPFNTVGAPASCKNVFAVGATNNANFGGGTSYVVDFSSRGPTSDGRTKPDIMAPGYALNSAGSGWNRCGRKEPAYLKAGTSMATPVIAGAGALVRQYFMNGFYPCGSKGCGSSINPSGALVKAVLANGAQPLNGVQVGGTTNVLNKQPTEPYDDTQNMGISNLLTSLPLKDENNFGIFIDDASLQSGKKLSFDFAINLNGCSSDFAATIAWYDPPASNGCSKCLVNDLDLLVENLQTSEKFFPNGLSKPDTKNNLERVRVKDTAIGQTYRVTVKTSMLGPGYNKQNVALVVTGCFTDGNTAQDGLTSKPSETSSSHDLATTYNADRKQAGNMFSIQAKTNGVQITSFAMHTLLSDVTVTIHVYVLNTYGGISGNDNFLSNRNDWTQISPSNGIKVEAKGFGTPTVIPVGSFQPVSIPKGRIQSFYITLVGETEMLYKAVKNDFPTGSVFSSDDAISIFSGVGKGPDFGATWRHRQMNGAVYYNIIAN